MGGVPPRGLGHHCAVLLLWVLGKDRLSHHLRPIGWGLLRAARVLLCAHCMNLQPQPWAAAASAYWWGGSTKVVLSFATQSYIADNLGFSSAVAVAVIAL